MKKISLLALITLLTLSLEATILKFDFPRTIYVKKDSNKKVITISSPNIKEDDYRDIKLYIRTFSQNETENYTQCVNATNNTSIFHCILTSNGTYDFKYKVDDEEFKYLNEKIYVYNSIDEIFTYSSSRDTNCYFHNESFYYTLNKKKGINLNYVNFQVYAYHPKSIRKNISQPIIIELKRNENEYFFKNEHTLRQYEIRVTQNRDFEDPIGIIQNITFTNINVDNYFYPEYGKIRFSSDFCDFKPNSFVLTDEDNNNYTIKCSKNYIYYNTRSLFCYFNENINKYGNMKVYFGGGEIGNVYSSRTLNKTQFTRIKNEKIIENNVEYIHYVISDITNEFYMSSLNKLYVNLFNGVENNYHTYDKNSNSGTDKKLYFNDNHLSIKIKYERGINYTAIKLEREIFEDENIQTAYDVYYNLNELIYEFILDTIYFEPNFIVLPTSNFITGNYFETKLYFISKEANSHYGNEFCSNGKASFTFNCTENNDNFKKIKFVNIPPPGYLETQLIHYTYPAKLKVIKFDISNHCQNNIFGSRDNLEDSIVNVYYPIDGNKKITVKYNGNEISENPNAVIQNNPFDYTFITFVISKNILTPNGNVEIFYDGLLIGTANLKYSNSIIPTFTQKILNINDSRNQIKIRFTKPMTIGVDETRFTLENVNGYSKNCNLDSNKIILTCENINSNFPLRLYSHTDCGGKEELDFLVYSYSKPKDTIQFSKKYFLLSKNKASISFSMTYTSVLETFPIKVHINGKDPSEIQVKGNSRIYIYKTNKAGEYIFSYLDSNKKNITRNDVKFQVRNQLNVYYSKNEIDKK